MAASLIPPNLKSYKYYAPASAGTVAGADLTINATDFVNDSGAAVTAFPSYASFTLFINGMPQQNGIATVTTTSVVITGGATLDPSDPVVLNLVVNF
ncbi:hypothetical protein CIG75_13110 [Tumebacillus algifaecis]|uniref:DUF4183 domain-containing protein n=1 Tax=Tumebacillus algifaecis TaxID=1214604 RepID=A0A223D317_9BACL|nr:DUF4183 domain-containing protein [Tumebacillus algifaecis]ASS75833.1 hypothetical protein CIG75_13110 [Tumebacillus algifaecis]